jgi:type IV pilus assembly protein PilY1
MVYVGTGKFVEADDNGSIVPQSFYGVRDCGLNTAGCPYTAPVVRGAAGLRSQQITNEEVVANYGYGAQTARIISDNDVNTLALSDPAEYRGFYVDLFVQGKAKEGERVTAKPVVWADRLIFNTIVPGTSECQAEGTGFLYEVDPYDGQRLAFSVFDVDGNGEFGNATDVVGGKNVSGLKVGMGGGIMTRDGNKYVGNVKGAVVKVENKRDGLVLGRRSWRKLR